MIKSIIYAANEWGYIVQLIVDGQIRESWWGGNSEHDSQLVVPLNDPSAQEPRILQRYARKQAHEMAAIHGTLKIEYDSDLHDELYEHLPRAWRSFPVHKEKT
jgi:hypothetical protein